MRYRAHKIRQAIVNRLNSTVADLEWPDVIDDPALPLDPYPVQCAQDGEDRHAILGLAYCGTFSPRPGYEQDRSKYE